MTWVKSGWSLLGAGHRASFPARHVSILALSLVRWGGLAEVERNQSRRGERSNSLYRTQHRKSLCCAPRGRLKSVGFPLACGSCEIRNNDRCRVAVAWIRWLRSDVESELGTPFGNGRVREQDLSDGV